MSARKDAATAAGVGVAACAACCVGPIIGFIAALGIGTIAGALLFGLLGVVAVALGATMLLRRRRRNRCVPARTVEPVRIEPPRVRNPV